MLFLQEFLADFQIFLDEKPFNHLNSVKFLDTKFKIYENNQILKTDG